uniref:hypothetical protein n=1 Tax=Clostridium perfringens TaxID=1502 RepID=UPI000B2F32D5
MKKNIKNNEASRVEAENKRIEAENNRKQTLLEIQEEVGGESLVTESKTLKGGINEVSLKLPKISSDTSQNTNELLSAMTATTGEKFDSLDQRIDAEVDRLNKKIEVSMLEQESAESHVVENSVEGMTTDMIIKGNTLKNLSILPNKEYTTNTNIYYSLGKNNFRPSTKYMLICDIKDNEDLNILDKTTYLRVDDSTGETLGGYIGSIKNNYNRITFEFTTLSDVTGNLLLRQRMNVGAQQTIKDIVILEFNEIYNNIPYFESIKSFGQQEDKISILSSGKNIGRLDLSNKN